MYRCDITKRLSRPGEKCNKIVVQKRDRIYYEKILNEETREWENVEVARGWEIVKEIKATDSGLQAWNEMSPEERSDFVRSLS